MNVLSQVGEAISVLRTRLPDILQKRVEEIAPGVAWTTVLEEVDALKGRTRREPDAYASHDLQVQLRMLTERLARLGFPFDDGSRTVSTLGSELRNVRNLWAHTHEFSVMEGFRATDSIARLLAHFGDETGARQVEQIRNALLPDLFRELGLGDMPDDLGPTPGTAEQETVAPSVKSADEATDDSQQRVETAAGRSTQIARPVTDSTHGQLGDERTPFERWTPTRMGPPEVLDNLKVKGTAELVRAVAEEAIDAEGPIAEDRLIKLVLDSFGRRRNTSKVQKKLRHQLKNLVDGERCHRDEEDFYWPPHTIPEMWQEFRPSPAGAPGRGFDDISKVELRNAAREIQERAEGLLSPSELQRAVLHVFGLKRMMSRYGERLSSAVAGV